MRFRNHKKTTHTNILLVLNPPNPSIPESHGKLVLVWNFLFNITVLSRLLCMDDAVSRQCELPIILMAN